MPQNYKNLHNLNAVFCLRSFFNLLSSKVLKLRYNFTFGGDFLKVIFKTVQIILWKSDTPVEIVFVCIEELLQVVMKRSIHVGLIIDLKHVLSATKFLRLYNSRKFTSMVSLTSALKSPANKTLSY